MANEWVCFGKDREGIVVSDLIAKMAVIAVTTLLVSGLFVFGQWLSWNGPGWVMTHNPELCGIGIGTQYSLLVVGIGVLVFGGVLLHKLND